MKRFVILLRRLKNLQMFFLVNIRDMIFQGWNILDLIKKFAGYLQPLGFDGKLQFK